MLDLCDIGYSANGVLLINYFLSCVIIMRKYRQYNRILLFIALGAYAINKYIFSHIIYVTFMRNHFNDCMAGVVLVSILNELHIFWLKKKCSAMNAMRVVFMAALFWEYITPLYLTKSVGDIKDVVAYLAGGVCVVLILKIFD